MLNQIPPHRFSAFADNHVALLTLRGKATMDAYQPFPKNWNTLGVRWHGHHGVTAPLMTSIIA